MGLKEPHHHFKAPYICKYCGFEATYSNVCEACSARRRRERKLLVNQNS